MQEVRPRPLYRANRKGFIRVLGPDPLPDLCVETICWLIAAYKAGLQRMKRPDGRSIGHTPAKWAAETRRVANHMRRGHDGPEVTRTLTDPLFDPDIETFERLQDIGNLAIPLEQRLAAIKARSRELAALPEIDALYGARVSLLANALVCWYYFAVDREDTLRQWQFMLTMLQAAGEGTRGVYEHPERLKRDLGRLMQLTAQPAGPSPSDPLNFVPLLSAGPR